MSTFIANTISFSKDFKTFRVKGGDNNLVPRYNSWSSDIPIDRLYYNLNGGMIQLKGTSEKNAFIRFLVNDMNFGGEWNTETDYFHMKNQKPDSQEIKKFDMEFLTRLRDGLNNLDNENRYIIYLRNVGTYVHKACPTCVKTSMNTEGARKFSYYRAREIAENYQHKGAVVQ